MSDAADAAMSAIEKALAPIPASRMTAEIREELTVILSYMLGDEKDATEATKALSAFAGRMCFSISADDEDWDDGEGWLACDPYHLDEARARIDRGQVDDCLHHLERALPAEFAVIAERLAHRFRSRM